jgi:predicted AAA+ superfamily ATPase
MIKREFWLSKIEAAWTKRSVIWLSGVRRVGKTYLCKSLADVEYYNCELPVVQTKLEDPEQFFMKAGKRIIFDEIHALINPSLVLKIGADEFPDTKIIATGSSTLAARKKFKDTLTGRKLQIHLTPMLIQEGELFGNSNLEHRMLFGGLPPFFLDRELDEELYTEWFSSYFARDVQKLYNVDNEAAFIRFAQLVLARSSGIFDASRFAMECQISRPSVTKYLHLLEQTHVAIVVKPYSTDSSMEIVKAPKVYGFDTGFICYAKGWSQLRNEDFGELWEHLILNNLVGTFQQAITINYWRDKRDHEVDFVIKKNRDPELITVECKWSYKNFDPTNIKAFRRRYPRGKNFVVTANVIESFEKDYNGITITFVSLQELMSHLESK